MSEERQFLDSEWKEGIEPAKGGWFYRDFGLVDFIKKLEKDPRGGRVVCIKIDGNNLELLTKVSKEQLKKYLEEQESTDSSS